MRGAVLYGPRDVVSKSVLNPKLQSLRTPSLRFRRHASADRISGRIEVSSQFRSLLRWDEYCGIVEEIGSTVRSIKRGQFVIGSFFASDKNGEELFFAHVHLHGGPAPVRCYLPKLIELVTKGKIDPGKVFYLHSAPRPGGGWIPCDGRTQSHKDVTATLNALCVALLERRKLKPRKHRCLM